MGKKTIREWREEKNVSREALAAALGVSLGTIVNWEKDPGKMNVLKFFMLAKELGIKPDQILV